MTSINLFKLYFFSIIMNEGLDISEEQFLSMGSKERDLIMFRNMVYIRKQFKDYRLNKKIQYVWLSVLTVFAAACIGIRGWFI